MNALPSLSGFLISRALGLAGALLLAACGALPDKPGRATLYDFGPVGQAAMAASTSPAARPLLILPDIAVASRLDGTQMWYRLGYADARALHAYSQARWSLPPAQLLRQRLHEALSSRHTVLRDDEAAGLARTDPRAPAVLRLSLDEFSQHFEAPQRSAGVIRLHATLLRPAPGGERVVAQRSFSVQSPAATHDAPGGVAALVGASDALAGQVAEWLAMAPLPSGER